MSEVFQFNPWRAPGTAPVADACGMAGGGPVATPQGDGVFMETKFAKQGDLGSKVRCGIRSLKRVLEVC